MQGSVVATLVLKERSVRERLLAEASKTRLRTADWIVLSFAFLSWMGAGYWLHSMGRTIDPDGWLMMAAMFGGIVFFHITMTNMRVAALDRRLAAMLKLIEDKQN